MARILGKGRGALTPSERRRHLDRLRNAKMARSPHAYVRGNTVRFYEWLETISGKHLPAGPAVWICGDCHVGNLGPIGSSDGAVEIAIRDLDQTVIGNPVHDLIRLGLSLATAARGSALPGVVTAYIMEALVDGYEQALLNAPDDDVSPTLAAPDAVQFTMKRALGRRWKNLAKERLDDVEFAIPLGRRFWSLSKDERHEIAALFERESVRRLVTQLHQRPDDAKISVIDAAYWIKGCSSLGRLRYSVLLRVGHGDHERGGLCLMDIKEALQAAAPRLSDIKMPKDDAERVVKGAQHLSPYLGDRMMSARLGSTPVFLRELLPQDLKLEIEHLSSEQASKTARYLAWIVGKAHARQMTKGDRKSWLAELARNRTSSLDAPSWLWRGVVDLVANHEAGYLDHCRRYALAGAQSRTSRGGAVRLS